MKIAEKEHEKTISDKKNKLVAGTKEILVLFEEDNGLWINLQGKDRKEQIEKYYLCLVVGKMEGNGTISIPLYKDESRGMVFKGNIKDGAKEAITKYNVIGTNNEYSLVEVQILTGRTHQIRAHFKEINHPLVGDGKYGDFKINKEFNSEFNYDSQFLHAYKIKFDNLDGDFKYLSKKVFVSPLNNKEKEILNKLNIGSSFFGWVGNF